MKLLRPFVALPCLLPSLALAGASLPPGITPNSDAVLKSLTTPGAVTAGTLAGDGSPLTVKAPGALNGIGQASRAGRDVWVEEYGAVCDGTTDDYNAFVNAANAAVITGATVRVRRDRKCLINSNLNLPNGVGLEGAFVSPGEVVGADYFPRGSTILLNSAATINVGQSGSVRRLNIINPALTLPNADAAALNANLAKFLGTALNLGKDALVEDNLIIGYNQCIQDIGNERVYIYRNRMDCNNGVLINGSTDVSRVVDNHAWNYITGHQSLTGAGWQSAYRAGVAFKEVGGSGSTIFDRNFSFGYQVGFSFGGPLVLATNNHADCNPNQSVAGTCTAFIVPSTGINAMLTNNLATAQTIGFQINTQNVQLTNNQSNNPWSTGTHFLLATNSRGIMIGNQLQGPGTKGIDIGAATAWRIKETVFQGVPVPFSINSAAVATTDIGGSLFVYGSNAPTQADTVSSKSAARQSFGTRTALAAVDVNRSHPPVTTLSPSQASTSGSTVLYFASTTGIALGAGVADGTSIPAGTTVTALTPTTVTLSAAITADIPATDTVTFSNPPVALIVANTDSTGTSANPDLAELQFGDGAGNVRSFLRAATAGPSPYLDLGVQVSGASTPGARVAAGTDGSLMALTPPSSTGTYNLGTSALPWSNVKGTHASFTDVTAATVIVTNTQATSGQTRVATNTPFGDRALNVTWDTVTGSGQITNIINLQASKAGTAAQITTSGGTDPLKITPAGGADVQIGNSLSTAGYVKESFATGLTATGSTQADALLLSKQYNIVTSVAAGSGVQIPAVVGARITVVNGNGTNSLAVYPQSGQQIGGAGANIAASIATGQAKAYLCVSTTQCYTVQ